MTRDLIWDALIEVAVRLNQRTSDLEVKAARRWSFRKWEVVEGLEVGDDWTDVFEPVVDGARSGVGRSSNRCPKQLPTSAHSFGSDRTVPDTRSGQPVAMCNQTKRAGSSLPLRDAIRAHCHLVRYLGRTRPALESDDDELCPGFRKFRE